MAIRRSITNITGCNTNNTTLSLYTHKKQNTFLKIYNEAEKMRQIWKDKMADVGMVGAAVAILVTIMVSILIVYNIAGSLDTTTIDAGLTGTPAANATDNTLTQAATFYTLAPLVVVVIAAVVILGYVMSIGYRK